ncbi:MAG TPA: VOC family protein [Candidatus Dormibacteraeota bacterium]|nr:VOC family protein [Candidatus Dormibacteraeota bacterium]
MTAPMRLGNVSVYVTDQERALAFYRDLLGFNVRSDVAYAPGFRWLTVAPEGDSVQLVLVPAAARDGHASAERIGGWSRVVFQTEDIDLAYRELVARGVPFDGEPEPTEWGGTQATFHDPDGNEFLLVQTGS